VWPVVPTKAYSRLTAQLQTSVSTLSSVLVHDAELWSTAIAAAAAAAAAVAAAAAAAAVTAAIAVTA
jgi:hypothetical protein